MLSTRDAITSLPLSILLACASPQDERGARAECFEIVCRTIEESIYDEGLAGIEWASLVDACRPRIEQVEDDEEFYVLMNELLFALGVSHLCLIPDEHPEWIGAPAVFSDGEVGISVRLVEDEVIVVRVRPGSAADAAGVRPGARLSSIGGRGVDRLRSAALEPPLSPLAPDLLETQAVQLALFGSVGSEIELGFTNPGQDEQVAKLRCAARPGRSTLLEGIPPAYLEIEQRRLEGKIGYLRFNAFDPALLDDIDAALDGFADTVGLVIDLRGNPGGTFHVRRGLAERLVTEPCVIWRQSGRRGVFEVSLTPPAQPYAGEVVVLTDRLSCSSSEELAGGLQALGRATVVGQRTAGVVLIAETLRLDIGATLVYPVAETILADGSTLEGKGVLPDIEVEPSRTALAAGTDEVLDAAVAHILQAVAR